MRKNIVHTKLCKSFALFVFTCVAACSQVPEDKAVADLIGWEEFERNATTIFDGQISYRVEWDMAVSHAELRAYYDRYVAEAAFANDVVDNEENVGSAELPLIVNTVNGVDDIWTPTKRFNLRYCVSNDFGSEKSRAVSEMAQAAAAWEDVAGVDFIYVPSQDGNCSNVNYSITFAVRPWTSGGACAFFPSGGGCVARTLVMNFTDFATNPFYHQKAPALTTTGVFTHELGHILGFRHEHVLSGICPESGTWRSLTPYDSKSTMHYQWCQGVLTSNLSLTPLDKAGAALVYPKPVCNLVQQCHNGTTISCVGYSTCDQLSTCSISWDGAVKSCPTVPGVFCAL